MVFLLFKYCYLIAAIFMCGDVVSSICFKGTFKGSLPLRISIAYGLGTGTLVLLSFYLSYLGGTISFKNVFFLSLPFTAYFTYSKVKNFRTSGVTKRTPCEDISRKSILDYFFLVLIVVSLSIIIFRALYLPKRMPDDRAQWGIKAKILYHEGTIYADDFFDSTRVMYHAHYPFLVPLIESLFYDSLGEMNDGLGKIPFPLFFAALLLFFYGSQRRFANNRHALMFTSMMAVLPCFIKDVHGNPSSGYADVPLIFYYTISVISLFHWMKDHKIEDLLMATICILFAIFTKREGLVLWAIATIVLLIYLLLMHNERVSRKVIWGGIFAVVPLFMLLPWFHFYNTFVLGPWEKDFELSYLTYTHVYPLLHRVPLVLQSILKEFFMLRYFSIIGILFFITVVLSPKDILRPPLVFLPLLISLNIVVLVMAILIYPWPWWQNFIHDLPRLLMVNIPLMMFTISYQTQQGKFLEGYAS